MNRIAGSLGWLEVLRTCAAVATAFLAGFALRNWRRQDSAKRKAAFLDGLIEATNAYMVEVSTPLS